MEMLGPKDWEDFLSAPIAVLMLGKTDCAACEEWTAELQRHEIPEGVRIGKILLDKPGYVDSRLLMIGLLMLTYCHSMQSMSMVK
jgi:hypothetical protein